MSPVRVARAFQLPIIAATVALSLSGCMLAGGPVAFTQSRSDLDALAYGGQAWAALAEAQAAAVRGLEAMVDEMNAFTRSEIAAAADGAAGHARTMERGRGDPGVL